VPSLPLPITLEPSRGKTPSPAVGIDEHHCPAFRAGGKNRGVSGWFRAASEACPVGQCGDATNQQRGFGSASMSSSVARIE
jgi:hypothetical protein